jgi:hypothetical protein
MDHPAADEAADLVGREILAGQDRDDPGHGFRGRLGDAADVGVRMRRADEIRAGLARTGQVVRVAAHAGDETLILLAAHPCPDPGRGHGSPSPVLHLIPRRVR